MALLRLKAIFEYAHCTMDSRNFTEGEEVLFAKHVRLCGRVNNDDNVWSIYALVLQTSALSAPPHVVTGEIERRTLTIKQFQCSCKAGASECCKHVLAVLLFCHRTDMNSLEVLSSTDKKCLWSELKGTALQRYQIAEPVTTFCCHKATERRVLNLHREEIYQRAVARLPKSALAMHAAGSNTKVMEEEWTEDVPNETVKIIISQSNSSNLLVELTRDCYIDEPQDCCSEFYLHNVVIYNAYELCVRTLERSEWRKERSYRVTGSRCYGLYTYKGNDWQGKTMRVFNARAFSNKCIEHGILQEPAARLHYEEVRKCRVAECGLVVSECEPWLGYSPDGMIMDNGKPVGLIEIKCPYEGKDSCIEEVLPKCSFLSHNPDSGYCLKRKHPYYGQITLGMILTNVFVCDFVVYCSKDNSMFIERIHLDTKFGQLLVSELKLKYFKHTLPIFCKNH